MAPDCVTQLSHSNRSWLNIYPNVNSWRNFRIYRPEEEKKWAAAREFFSEKIPSEIQLVVKALFQFPSFLDTNALPSAIKQTKQVPCADFYFYVWLMAGAPGTVGPTRARPAPDPRSTRARPVPGQSASSFLSQSPPLPNECVKGGICRRWNQLPPAPGGICRRRHRAAAPGSTEATTISSGRFPPYRGSKLGGRYHARSPLPFRFQLTHGGARVEKSTCSKASGYRVPEFVFTDWI